MAHAEGGDERDTPALLRVEVAYAPAPRTVDVVALRLPPGVTVAEAVAASGLAARHGLDPASLHTSVWCRTCDSGTPLRDRDRVEITRDLLVDPKEARRQRYRQHLAAGGLTGTRRR